MPNITRPWVERTKLVQQFTLASPKKITLIQAPAGYGKSWLLQQWLQQLRQQKLATTFISLDSSQQHALAFIDSIEKMLTKTLQINPTTDNQTSNAESSINNIVRLINSCQQPIFICLDNLQKLSKDAQIVLDRLIERSPHTTHFILASRVTPALHLARARAQGNLFEIGVSDLQFNQHEVKAYLYEKINLTEQEQQLLLQRTEGWIVGISLVCQLLISGKQSAIDTLQSLTGNNRLIADYFNEEALSTQPLEIRQFLLNSCVLKQLSNDICSAISTNQNNKKGSTVLLNNIEQAGLFLVALDNERNVYRYHGLFSEFLQRKLKERNPQAEQHLCKLASKWYLQTKQYEQTIEYALRSNDSKQALNLLEQQCFNMAFAGKLRLVKTFSEQIATPLLKQKPRLQLVLAWLATRNLNFEETRKLLGNVSSIMQQNEQNTDISDSDAQQLRYLFCHQKMMLAAAQDNAKQTEEYCLTLLEDFPEQQHPYLSGTVHTQLLYARREQYKLRDVEHLQAMAQGILGRSSYSFASIGLQASVGPSLFFVGRTGAARRALEQGLQEGIRYGGENSSLAALPALPLAEIIYEANEINFASQLVEGALPYATELGFVDQLMPGYLTLARIKKLQGDTAAAFDVLEQGLCIATERKLERLRVAIAGETIRLLIHNGRLDQAGRYANEANILPNAQGLLAHGNCTSLDELRAMVWVRLELGEDRTAEAINTAKNWRRFCMSKGAIRSLIQWNILLAQLYYLNGDQRAAQRSLREAMTHAAPSRMLRSFIDEGSIIQSLLSSVNSANVVDKLHPTDVFSAELLQLFENTNGHNISESKTTNAEGLYGKLTSREREILSLVGSGMRNNEIALKLGMTEGSVKWYMQQIFDKMGTRRRLQAVERAKQFGLIIA